MGRPGLCDGAASDNNVACNGAIRNTRPSYENQQHRASGLNLVVTAIILWNMRYGFVIKVAGSKLNALIWPLAPWVTTTPSLKSIATTRPLAKILDTLFNNMVLSISVL